MSHPHFWLRAETKPNEQRAALTPYGAKQMRDLGYMVTIEYCEQRIFPIEAYEQAGCIIAPKGSWINAPQSAYIIGLKELPEANEPLVHQHIYFAHAYKNQQGAAQLLDRFNRGGGTLLDLEYLVDNNHRRVAAFGYWAGFAGAALAVWGWANQQGAKLPLAPLNAFENQQELVKQVANALAQCKVLPRLLVIGAKGRSGKGAKALADLLTLDTIGWDIEETRNGGPFSEINQFDILINCVMINQALPPFVTEASIDSPTRQLSMIADVSCDPYGSYNPIPLYKRCTTFSQPIINLIEQPKPLALIAIDHLPSLLPRESSEDYEQQLLPHLLSIKTDDNHVWQRALDLFEQKRRDIEPAKRNSSTQLNVPSASKTHQEVNA
ncbi:saccharopine dehydrogenase [Thalassotalea ganghwensis]